MSNQLLSAEICSNNKQKKYNSVFRSQEKKILVSFDGRRVCFEFYYKSDVFLYN